MAWVPINTWMKQAWCVYTIGYYSVIKKNERLPFTGRCAKLLLWQEKYTSLEDKCHVFFPMQNLEFFFYF